MTIIRDSFERAQLLRTTHGTWIVASLVTEMFWPLKAQSADYEGKEFLLLPMRGADRTPSRGSRSHRRSPRHRYGEFDRELDR
jgi:hypothetical protein